MWVVTDIFFVSEVSAVSQYCLVLVWGQKQCCPRKQCLQPGRPMGWGLPSETGLWVPSFQQFHSVKLSFPGSKAPLRCSPPAAGKVPNCLSEHHQPAAIPPQGKAGKGQWRHAAAVHGSWLLSKLCQCWCPCRSPAGWASTRHGHQLWQQEGKQELGWQSLPASACAPDKRRCSVCCADTGLGRI